MLWLSWGKWPDVLVDFGRELYVPWMLAEGKVLYKDLLYFRGPLSPYCNALWFFLFGPSLYTLVWVNIVLLVIMMVVMYRVLCRVSSSFAAFIACLVFVLLFAFNQYVGIANYNYVCPYAHEATHAMLLSWVALGCLMVYTHSRQVSWLAGAGFILGLIFLIKPEFFLAVAAASATALGLLVWLERPRITSVIKSFSVLIATLLIPPFIAFILMATKLSWYEAGIGTLGEWWHIWHSSVSGSPFFRVSMGFENPLGNIKIMLSVAGVYAYFFSSAIAMAIIFRRRRSFIIVALLEAVVVFALAWLFWKHLPWYKIGRPLPLLLIILGGWNLALLIRQREKKYLVALILIIFSLVLLGKMLLNTRIHHYGFVLAMPATLVMVVAMIDWIPTAIKRKGGRQLLFYIVVFALLGVITLRYINISVKRYALKSVTVGKGMNKFLTDQRGEFVNLAVEWLKSNTKKGETLAVFPEGITINYLARIKNSTPILTAVPPNLVLFGEERMLQLIKEAPPTYIALVHRDDTEYGYRFFGLNYAQSIMNWFREEYHPVLLIGAQPFQDNRFGILIIKRKTDNTE